MVVRLVASSLRTGERKHSVNWYRYLPSALWLWIMHCTLHKSFLKRWPAKTKARTVTIYGLLIALVSTSYSNL